MHVDTPYSYLIPSLQSLHELILWHLTSAVATITLTTAIATITWDTLHLWLSPNDVSAATGGYGCGQVMVVTAGDGQVPQYQLM